jgi:hypothetical protein
MMYYWIVKHDGSEARDIISYREELSVLRSHHIIVESLSPLLSGASFALGHQIKTERTWRDLNDTLVTYLQSRRVRGDEEQPALGVNLGTNNPLPACGRALIQTFDLQGRSGRSRTLQCRTRRRYHSPNPAGEYSSYSTLC